MTSEGDDGSGGGGNPGAAGAVGGAGAGGGGAGAGGGAGGAGGAGGGGGGGGGGGAVSAAGEEAMRSLLCSLRTSMREEQEGGASLDPLPVEKQVIGHQHPALHATVTLYNMTLVGLSEFEIEDIQLNVSALTVTVSLSYSKLSLHGEYDLNGKLVKVIPLRGHGPFVVVTSSPKVSLRARLKEHRGKLEVSQLHSDLEFETVRCHFANITGGSFVNRVLSTVLTDVLRRERTRLARDLSTSLKTLFNNELRHINLGVSLHLLRTSDKFM